MLKTVKMLKLANMNIFLWINNGHFTHISDLNQPISFVIQSYNAVSNKLYGITDSKPQTFTMSLDMGQNWCIMTQASFYLVRNLDNRNATVSAIVLPQFLLKVNDPLNVTCLLTTYGDWSCKSAPIVHRRMKA